jgi:hypothetical protein
MSKGLSFQRRHRLESPDREYLRDRGPKDSFLIQEESLQPDRTDASCIKIIIIEWLSFCAFLNTE